MYYVLANFCECENTLRFSSVVSVFSMPPIGDELMLREVIEPSYDCIIFYPDDELGEFPTRSFHTISESKDHLIWVKDITCVFLSEKWYREPHPFLSKACICFIGLESIISYILVMKSALIESYLWSYIVDAIRNICQDKFYLSAFEDFFYRFTLCTISTEKYMFPENKYTSWDKQLIALHDLIYVIFLNFIQILIENRRPKELFQQTIGVLKIL